MAIPAAREPGPLVILLRCRTVAKVDSIVIWSSATKSGCDLLGCVLEGVLDESCHRCGRRSAGSDCYRIAMVGRPFGGSCSTVVAELAERMGELAA